MQWVVRINEALDADRFCLYARVILSVSGRGHTSFELLIRLLDGDKLIPPSHFLTAAERYNLMPKIDRWVVRSAFQYFTENPDFLDTNNFCSMNLSGQSVAEPEFLEYMIMQFSEFDIDTSKICFEITETAAVSNLSMAIKFISTLKGLGWSFALDDCGSGFSSFAYLKNLPVDYLKIDGLFVRDILQDPIDLAMVKYIKEIGQLDGHEDDCRVRRKRRNSRSTRRHRYRIRARLWDRQTRAFRSRALSEGRARLSVAPRTRPSTYRY